MNDELKASVRRRANDTCEYCRLPQSGAGVDFEIDHILARKHGGASTLDNLALACVYCNAFKGSDMAGIDPATGDRAFLFNPRVEAWAAHFAWSGPVIVGVTATGRATVRTLRMNSRSAIELRSALAAEGLMRFEG